MVALHPVQRRYFAEDLVRLRPPTERRRFVASQRAATIDPNPHQVDAVIFALSRIPEGGCILADEVGLGKTIEAGLVIAQLRAEGAERVLLLVPKPLLGQWRQELATLFWIEAREVLGDAPDLVGEGVFLMSRDAAGSERGAAALASAQRFDLCVIDEAHEVFAGIYRRFDRAGRYDDERRYAVIAGRVRSALEAHGTPFLLLTATPIQNSLVELWGLVHYVDPTSTLLGDLSTFRATFCAGDDRELVEDQQHELRRRLARVCQRTLRRQAQEFLEQPFVPRRAQLFEYSMSDAERALYRDVTDYLLDPDIGAFRGNHRRLLVIGFHRRMASSIPALAASLGSVARRLERLAAGDLDADGAAAMVQDLEDFEDDATERDEGVLPEVERLLAERQRVLALKARALALPTDSKAEALVRAVRLVQDRARRGEGSGKVVVFTESLTTQDYLRDLLVERDVVSAGDVTRFRGNNDGDRAAEALERWQAEVGVDLPDYARPSRAVAVRLALVHEFATRSNVFLSTEAGAKGLNLQFCETLVNYDLPWNPQRIEQRIGRCHRYGQTRPVTVINFLAKDNEAQRLTFEILSDKLELFGAVLDASDVVLQQADASASELWAGAFGVEFEGRLRRIYESAGSADEIAGGLRELSGSVDRRRAELERVHRRTLGLIDSRFDGEVQASFRRLAEQLPEGLAELDRDIARVVGAYLATQPDAAGAVESSLHLGHPLVRAAVAEARASGQGRFSCRIELSADAPSALRRLRGRRGVLTLLKVRHKGSQAEERLLPLVLLEGVEESLPVETAAALFAARLRDQSVDPSPGVTPLDRDDAVERAVFLDQIHAADSTADRFERELAQIERYLDDRLLVLRRDLREQSARVAEAVARRDTAVGAAARSAAERTLEREQRLLEEQQEEFARLLARDDEGYRRWRARALARRYDPPDVSQLLEMEFEIG
ncbi:MAG: SNF2-related protein [Planctomycetota bacterium]